MTNILGPTPCATCHRPVWWDRVGTTLRLMERRREHVCPGPIDKRLDMTCGVWMRHARDFCARRAGHSGDHRRRLVMNADAQARWAKRQSTIAA